MSDYIVGLDLAAARRVRARSPPPWPCESPCSSLRPWCCSCRRPCGNRLNCFVTRWCGFIAPWEGQRSKLEFAAERNSRVCQGSGGSPARCMIRAGSRRIDSSTACGCKRCRICRARVRSEAVQRCLQFRKDVNKRAVRLGSGTCGVLGLALGFGMWVESMEVGLVFQHSQSGTQVIGLEAAGIERSSLHQVPGVNLVLFLVQDFANAAIGRAQVTTQLPLAHAPTPLGRVLADIGAFRSGQDKLHDLVDATLREQTLGALAFTGSIGSPLFGHNLLLRRGHALVRDAFAGDTFAGPDGV